MTSHLRFFRILRIQPTTSPQKVLRVLVFTIIASAVLLGALIAWNRARQVETTAARLITQKATIARGESIIFFRPIMSQLGLIQSLGRQGILDPSDQGSFKVLWAPLMASLDQQVDSATVMTSEAQLIRLTRSGLEWDSRTSELSGPGTIPSWFLGALENEETDRIFWDRRTAGSGKGMTGVTASIAWTGAGDEGKSIVVAFHVGPEVVERFIRQLLLGETGEVLLLGNPDTVVRFSLDIEGYVEMSTQGTFFSVVADGEETPLFYWLEQLDNDTIVPKPFRFSQDGKRWWATASPLRIGERTNWIGLALPEKSLLADLREELLLLLYVLFAVLAMGVISLGALARQYGGELQQIYRGRKKDPGR